LRKGGRRGLQKGDTEVLERRSEKGEGPLVFAEKGKRREAPYLWKEEKKGGSTAGRGGGGEGAI